MENDKRLEESTCYTLNDKHFWAAFLNLARHNVYITINHINKLLEIRQIDNDEKVLDIKALWQKVDKDINQKARLRELMIKHFPFLEFAIYNNNKDGKQEEKQAKAQSFKSLKDCLFLFLEKLQEARNYYSHYKSSESSKEPGFEEGLLEKMYNTFGASIRLVKEDY